MRAIKYFIINAAFFGCGIYGEIYHQRWAWNVFVFFFWTQVALGTVIAFSDKGRAEAQKKGRSVPEWVGYSIDILLCVALAASGYFWMAGFWMWQTLCSLIVWNIPPKSENEKS